jgi:hypothetical protein
MFCKPHQISITLVYPFSQIHNLEMDTIYTSRTIKDHLHIILAIQRNNSSKGEPNEINFHLETCHKSKHNRHPDYRTKKAGISYLLYLL